MLTDRAWRCRIRKHLEGMRRPEARPHGEGPRIYASWLERLNMELCHDAAVIAMSEFMDGLCSLKYDAALEVGCGDGRVTRDLLMGRFGQVELFDPCLVAFEQVMASMARNWQVMRIEQAAMESFEWHAEYSLIVLRWCIGYPADEDLVAFLRAAKERLMPCGRRTTRNSVPQSFILVLDNLLEAGQQPFEDEGQTIRGQGQIEQLFMMAGLRIHMQSERIRLHPRFMKVMMWALY